MKAPDNAPDQLSDIVIRAARPNEAGALSALAFRSKAYWGYPDEFMRACRAELTYSPAAIRSPDMAFCVAERGGDLVGFFALERLPGPDCELEALFVEPRQIGRGVGRALVRHAKRKAAAWGARTMTIQGDPNALRFYLAAGGVVVGERASASIAGRTLPLIEIGLARDPRASSSAG